MKKIVLGLFVAASSLAASAQQINGTFDATWNACKPYTGGSTTTAGKTPQGWNSANVAGMSVFGGWQGTTIVVTEGTGRTGKGAVIANTPNSVKADQIVPGYLALGTPWNTAQGSNAKNPDGGTFGGITFSNKPDAVRFYYKRSATVETNTATVVAYLWSGSWSQANVPVNIGLLNTKKVTMTDRDRNILGKTTSQGGSVTNNNGVCIASLEYSISNLTDTWTEMVIPFTYHNKTQTPEKLNVIFAANDYFNPSVPAGSTLTIDDVDLVYYSTLSALSYDGASIAFAENTLSYNLSNVYYDAAKVHYTLKGIAATATTSYDETTAVLTITVTNRGNLNAADDTTVYTIQFKKPLAVTAGNTVSTTAGTHNVIFTREFKKGWNTLCLPFNLPLSAFTGTTPKLQTFSSAANGALNFASAGSIEANKPYLIFFDNAYTMSSYLEAITVKAASPTAVTSGEFTFIGNYSASLNMDDKYGVATGTDGKQRIMLGGAGSTLKSTGAYFTSTSAKANGMRICLEGEDGVTSIDGVTVVNGNAPIYNLQGVKVGEGTTEGLAKGIYIVNGKKFIVK